MSSVGRHRRDQFRSSSATTFFVVDVLLVVIAFQMLMSSAVAVRRSRVNSRDICERDPPDVRADSLPGDRGFRIQILGHSLRYAPRQVYTVAINGSYPNQKMSGFMLVAVPLHARDETTAMGTFQHIDTASTRFVPNCPHVVTDVTRHPKSYVEVLWTAPSTGAGCVEFRATVIERGEVWFRDDGALTRVFCEDTRTTESERSPEMIPDCCACGTAKYQLTFQGKWSHASHPKEYPTQRRLLHWSNIVGASHSRNYMIWQYGGYATRGVKEVCELGYPRTVEDEIQQRSREVRSIIKTTGIWWSEPHGIDQSRTARFSTDRRRHLMSMLTMIGPSPDWCVGVTGIDMCLPNCTWAGDMNIDLYPWDAGTDDGITYMSPNARSDPQQKIHRITNQFPDNPESPFHGRMPIRPLATLQIRRLNAPSSSPSPTDARPERTGSGVDALQCTDNNDVEDVLEVTDTSAAGLTDMEKQKLMMMLQQDGGKCAMSPWDDWSGCSVTCGVGLRVRKRVYINPMVDESMCGLPLMESENCIGLENECETVNEDCAMTAWSSWSPCSASCEKGVRQRRRYYLNKEDMARCSREADETEMCIAEIMDCEKARAMAQSTAACSLPVSVGPCRGNFPRWHYDNIAGRCVQFSYGGCRGNGNRFDSEDECLRVCGGSSDHQVAVLGTPATTTSTTTTTTVQPPSSRQSSCSLPKESGPCRANIHSWYFDTDMGKCLPFIYGGCRGNGNRFANEDECTDVCVLLLEPPSQRPLATDRTTSTTTTTPITQRSQPRVTRPPTTTTASARTPTSNGTGVAKSAGRSTALAPVHCSVSVWSSWSSCPVTCGTTANQAWRTRQRQVRRAASNGGRACPRQMEQRKKCDNLSPCPTGTTSQCPMSPWSEWSPCSKTCGTDAVQERESHVMPDGTGTDQCSGSIRLLRRICSDLPPCPRAQSSPETTIVRRSRSRSLV